MGMIEDMKDDIQIKQAARVVLKSPITLDELYALMTERWDRQKYGGFKLSKVLFVKNIEFDDYLLMRYSPLIISPIGQEPNAGKIKNNIVMISGKKFESKASSSYGKDVQERVRAEAEALGLNGKSWTPNELYQYGLNHLKTLTEGLRETLRDRLDPDDPANG